MVLLRITGFTLFPMHFSSIGRISWFWIFIILSFLGLLIIRFLPVFKFIFFIGWVQHGMKLMFTPFLLPYTSSKICFKYVVICWKHFFTRCRLLFTKTCFCGSITSLHMWMLPDIKYWRILTLSAPVCYTVSFSRRGISFPAIYCDEFIA